MAGRCIVERQRQALGRGPCKVSCVPALLPSPGSHGKEMFMPLSLPWRLQCL